MSIPINEQETTISFSRGSSEARIWTSDTTVMTKLDKLVAKSENYTTGCVSNFLDGELASKEYVIKDKGLISFRARRTKVELSDEERRIRTEKLLRANERRKASAVEESGDG